MIEQKNRHTPNRLSSYLQIHDTVISQFQDKGFVGTHNLSVKPYPSAIGIRGEMSCIGNIIISVDKILDILDDFPGLGGDKTVKTNWYAYNVSVRNVGNIFRYDNQHEDYLYPGHQDSHHKHVFDLCTGKELIQSPEWVGVERWPTLGDVIIEVQGWYWENRDSLPEPDSYPVLALPSLEL